MRKDPYMNKKASNRKKKVSLSCSIHHWIPEGICAGTHIVTHIPNDLERGLKTEITTSLDVNMLVKAA